MKTHSNYPMISPWRLASGHGLSCCMQSFGTTGKQVVSWVAGWCKPWYNQILKSLKVDQVSSWNFSKLQKCQKHTSRSHFAWWYHTSTMCICACIYTYVSVCMCIYICLLFIYLSLIYLCTVRDRHLEYEKYFTRDRMFVFIEKERVCVYI